MGRLLTTGYEVQEVHAEGFNGTQGAGTITYSTTNPRTGGRSRRVDASAAAAYDQALFVGAVGTTYFARAYVRFSAISWSVTAATILGFQAGSGRVAIRLTTDTAGFGLYVSPDATLYGQIGSGFGQLEADRWYRIEVSIKIGAGGNDDAVEMLVDGVSIASSAIESIGTTAPTLLNVGITSVAAGFTLDYDDVALNDSGGASQNSWPGSGKVALLLPTANSAVGTGWVGGAGGAASFNAVDNTPPVGVADTGTDTSQIRNATAAANSSYDATMTTYTAAGIAAVDTINVVVPIVETGAPVVTSAKAGTVGVVSNPTITNVALAAAGTPGAFWQGNAAGTFPTGWKFSAGSPAYAPSVTVGTAPVMRITQVTSSTRIADVCFMGMYVDYTPGVAARVVKVSQYPQLLAH